MNVPAPGPLTLLQVKVTEPPGGTLLSVTLARRVAVEPVQDSETALEFAIMPPRMARARTEAVPGAAPTLLMVPLPVASVTPLSKVWLGPETIRFALRLAAGAPEAFAAGERLPACRWPAMGQCSGLQ